MTDKTLLQISQVIAAIISCGISIAFLTGMALFWAWVEEKRSQWLANRKR
jgi:hypothetical protein